MTPAHVICALALAYASIGVVFALWFCAVGVQRRDPDAARAGLYFRVLIAPGVVGLWPIVLVRMRRSA